MTAFEELPFDVFFEISKNLDLDDIVHLSQTCRQVKEVLLNDTVSHQVVEAHHAYTEEARQARQGLSAYRETLRAIYDRRHAFSSAQPFSARIIGQGSSFLYRQGVLCVQTGHTISVTNLRSATPGVQMDLERIFTALRIWVDGDSIEMMYYSDEIISLHVTNKDRYEADTDEYASMLVSLKTTPGLSNLGRILVLQKLVEQTKLFIRHTTDYVIFGTHSGEGSDGHRKWVIKVCPITNSPFHFGKVNKDFILLEDFHGNDLGSTVAFEIHNNYFYAVSNQGTYEVEEVDWTSFYHCIRFPLNNSVVEAMQQDSRVYRRQHAEGAIHDSWTDLTLQHNESTNDLFIVESRREWIGATSKQARTFYTSRIEFKTPAFTDSSQNLESSSNNIAQPLPLPDNDILTTFLDSSHSANYMFTPEQYSWARHPEFPSIISMATDPRSFILARTKFRAYNYSCSTFLDLVEDGQCCPNRPIDSLPCLRLRIGSRRVAPDLYNPFGYEDGSTSARYSRTLDNPRGKRVQFADATQYRYTPVRMWPLPPSTCHCAARLHGIMNPVFRSTAGWNSGHKNITTICDERSIVYMVKPSRSYSYESVSTSSSTSSSSSSINTAGDDVLGTIVFIDFSRPTTTSTQFLGSTDNDQRWDWTPGQQSRCRSGTCR